MWPLPGVRASRCLLGSLRRAAAPPPPPSPPRRAKCNLTAYMPEAGGFEEVRSPSQLQRFSVSSSERFWAAAARHRLSWISDFHTVQDCDLARGRIKWFDGGKLNVSGKSCMFHIFIYLFICFPGGLWGIARGGIPAIQANNFLSRQQQVLKRITPTCLLSICAPSQSTAWTAMCTPTLRRWRWSGRKTSPGQK